MMISRTVVFLATLAALVPAYSEPPPSIHYSDLVSAPPAAFVTLYGQGFGDDEGAVQFGDAQADIEVWSDRRIVFRRPDIGESAAIVTTAGGTRMNPVEIRLHKGRVFFVSLSGNDRNNGLSAEERGKEGPFQTITAFLSRSRPGDVLYVREGNYDEIGDAVYGANVFIGPKHSGTQERPVAIVGYPGERAIIGRANTKHAIFMFDNLTNFVVANLEFTGRASALTQSPKGVRQNIRIIGNSATGIPARYGVFQLNSTVDLFVLGNTIRNSGQEGNKLSHLLYYGGFGPGDNVHISYNRLHGQFGGRCIQVYGHIKQDDLPRLFVQNNIIGNCRLDGILVGGSDEPTNRDWIDEVTLSGNTVVGAGAAGIRVNGSGMSAQISENQIAESGVALNIQLADLAIVRGNQLFASSSRRLFSLGSGGEFQISGNTYFEGTAFPSDREAQEISRKDVVIDVESATIRILR